MNVSAYRWFKHQYPGTFVEPHVQLQFKHQYPGTFVEPHVQLHNAAANEWVAMGASSDVG